MISTNFITLDEKSFYVSKCLIGGETLRLVDCFEKLTSYNGGDLIFFLILLRLRDKSKRTTVFVILSRQI